ncbi:MAG TPA: DMT family transporter [Tissierellaceae bacterium]|nr:DMT family transporter [Tissierellaceae bacterium]
MSRKMRGNLMLLFTAFIWGASFVAQISGTKEIGTFTFNFSRNIVASLSLFILIQLWPYIMKTPMKKETDKIKKYTIMGGVACGVVLTFAMSFQQLGLTGPNATTAGKAGFITALYIVLVPLTGIFIGKRISIKTWACVFLATIGLYLLSIKQGFSIQSGDLLVLVSAFFYALHILIIDYFSPKSNGVKLSMIQFIIAAFLSGVIMLLVEDVVWKDVFDSVIPILYAGMITSGVGFTLQIIAQKDTEPTMASLILSLESVFAVLAGAIILGERLSSREAIGATIMFIAIVLAQIPSTKIKKPRNI